MDPSLSDLTTQCIRCGFCLESCPTFMETGSEALSPRGRIYLVRSLEEGVLEPTPETLAPLESCLGCRACETACPSGVEYGAILEMARAKHPPSAAVKGLLTGLTDARLARLQISLSSLLPTPKLPDWLAGFLSKDAPEAWTPKPQARADWPELTNLPPVTRQVVLIEGCVMRVLFPRVHQATKRLLRRVGCEVLPSPDGCCGALHAHSGLLDSAESRAQRLAANLPPDVPIIVNSAGCGSTMKEYGHLVGKGLEGVASRVRDITEFLLEAGLEKVLARGPGLNLTATYHDACHLAHGQRITQPPRKLLAAIPGLTLKPLQESDTCCGSAGIYNLTQPKLARQLLNRKWANVEETGAQIVVSGNPGCHAWLAQAAEEKGRSTRVLHTAELLEASLSGWAGFGEDSPIEP